MCSLQNPNRPTNCCAYFIYPSLVNDCESLYISIGLKYLKIDVFYDKGFETNYMMIMEVLKEEKAKSLKQIQENANNWRK